MRIHDLAPSQKVTVGSTVLSGAGRTKKVRKGRGIGSGLGKTSGKGHKGQWARSGGGVRPGFEGGQLPLYRRLPKIGFKNAFKKVYAIVNLGDLEQFENGTVITEEILLAMRVIGKAAPYGVKVLADGEFTKKLTVQASKFSTKAAEIIVKNGGKVEVV